MNDPALPPSIAATLADLNRRLAALERAPQLPFSSTKGGRFRFLDDAGNERFSLGEVPADPAEVGTDSLYGVMFRGDGGAVVLGTSEGERGITYPALQVPMRDLTAPDKQVTSGSFVALFEARWDFPAHEVYRLSGVVSSSAGTTGEIRLRIGGTSTSVLTVPAGTNSFYGFEWLHPAPTGLFDPRSQPEQFFILALEARRTGGAGHIAVRTPAISELSSRLLVPTATTDGSPTLS